VKLELETGLTVASLSTLLPRASWLRLLSLARQKQNTEILASRAFEPLLETRSTEHTFAQIEWHKQLSGCYF
jgi:hypothetical protein